MGIRFHCPNGHKLNVKEFQAGRRGICPYCGARMTIPAESTRGPNQQSEEAETLASDPMSTTTVASQQTFLQAATTNDPPGGDDSGLAAETPVAEEAAQPAEATTPQPPSAPPPAADAADPLDEDPRAVWYVRPDNGGQFGPAPADVMRSWLDEGRLAANSLVWREGWPDWQRADTVFSQLQASGRSDDANPPPVASSAEGTDADTSHQSPRRRSGIPSTILIVVLVFAVILLIAVLIWVVNGSPNRVPETASSVPFGTTFSSTPVQGQSA